jgi:hypothetical protein
MEIELTIGLPCTHFRPASITSHFDESIITGTRAMSGSEAIRLRKRHRLPNRAGLVHVDVDDLRAVLDLLARHLQRCGVVAVLDQLAEARRAGDVGALADVDERNVAVILNGSSPTGAAAAEFQGRCAACAARRLRRWP